MRTTRVVVIDHSRPFLSTPVFFLSVLYMTDAPFQDRRAYYYYYSRKRGHFVYSPRTLIIKPITRLDYCSFGILCSGVVDSRGDCTASRLLSLYVPHSP